MRISVLDLVLKTHVPLDHKIRNFHGWTNIKFQSSSFNHFNEIGNKKLLW